MNRDEERAHIEKQMIMAASFKFKIVEVILSENRRQVLDGTYDKFLFHEALGHALSELFAIRISGLSEGERKVAVETFIGNALTLSEARAKASRDVAKDGQPT